MLIERLSHCILLFKAGNGWEMVGSVQLLTWEKGMKSLASGLARQATDIQQLVICLSGVIAGVLSFETLLILLYISSNYCFTINLSLFLILFVWAVGTVKNQPKPGQGDLKLRLCKPKGRAWSIRKVDGASPLAATPPWRRPEEPVADSAGIRISNHFVGDRRLIHLITTCRTRSNVASLTSERLRMRKIITGHRLVFTFRKFHHFYL